MKSLAGMSLRNLELLKRSIAKANPPPVLHRYRRPSAWTIKELTVPEVHVTGVGDMNDPFEYMAPVAIDLRKLKASMFDYARNELGLDQQTAENEADSINQSSVHLLQEGIDQLRATSGLICCSSDPLTNRMWAYYADAHRGICVGYNTVFSPFCLARKVAYADPDKPIDLLETLQKDPTLLSDHVSCRKGAEWAFEQEFRIPIGPFSEGHTRLLPISPEAIVEIRLGAKIEPDFKAQVIKVATTLPNCRRIIQLGCDQTKFQLNETLL